MKCPSCGRKLSDVPVAGMRLDVCLEGCHGTWFDQGELEKVDEKGEHHDAAVIDLNSSWSPTLSVVSKDRPCPKCKTTMRRVTLRAKKTFDIDECAQCGGIWLDANELARLRAQFPSASDRRQAEVREAKPGPAPNQPPVQLPPKFQRVFDIANGDFLNP